MNPAIKLPPTQRRGEANRERLVALLDRKSKALLLTWVQCPRVLSRGDLLDRVFRFAAKKNFNPAKSKNWNEQ